MIEDKIIWDDLRMGTPDCIRCKQSHQFAKYFRETYGHESSLSDVNKWPDNPCLNLKAEAHGMRISTVFLHTDYSLGGDPVWYETMVFATADSGTDIACERYGTKDDAMAGHEKMVRQAMDGGLSAFTDLSVEQILEDEDSSLRAARGIVAAYKEGKGS